ncbi:MAG TPA: hypothetical protein VFV86_05145 [Nitrososphaeraceae archaeon]|nr:hypothetical protein [Nitrososphaeraceae archaeon]
MPTENKNIIYLNKDFSSFKSALQEYAKSYYPNTFNDFSESSPGLMFMEMAAYVGDVLSFYLDTQTQETLLLYAKEKENLIALAYALGYRPKVSYASSTDLDIYQLIPSITVSGILNPDLSFGLVIPENTIVTSVSTGQKFLTTNKIDFSDTGSAEINFVNEDYFLFKKSVKVISGEIKSGSFSFGSPQKFNSLTINDDNILQILDVRDSDNNQWYEVSYLAQNTIFEKVENNSLTNPNYNQNDNIPYLAKLRKVPRRFTSRFRSDDTLELQFGAGISDSDDEEIIPNPNNVGLNIIDGISKLDQTYNNAQFLYTKEYGLAPSNTSLVVRYLVGGGLISNVPSNDLTNIDTSGVYFKTIPSNGALINTVLSSISSNNPSPALGGRGGDTVEEIRLNTLHSHTSQLRTVTKEDYVIRALSMPAEFGVIAKASVIQNRLVQDNTLLNDPLALDLYVLTYDSNKNLVSGSATLKENLKKYINQYRIITDSINIRDAFYINIGVNFDITVFSGYNNNEILTNCINTLKDYFNIDKWQINQPIIKSELQTILLQVKGVQSVVKIEIINKQGGNYSPYGYDISAATRNNIIYPSIDPSIFECRNMNTDLQGRIISL